VSDLVEATFSNCIVYGNERIEVNFNRSEDAAFNFKFENSLLRINPFNNQLFDEPEFDIEDPTKYENILLNELPLFFNPQFNQLIISSESPAVNLGNSNTGVLQDILGVPRPQMPDAGAYQSILFEQ
jgi:hypothetical protein